MAYRAGSRTRARGSHRRAPSQIGSRRAVALKDGFLLVDKPAGPTAHDVVDFVRRKLGIRRVGHTGTLDPFATGLLVVLVGRATRLSKYLVGLRKKYEGTMQLGVSTNTHDLTGEVTAEHEGWQDIDRNRIDRAAAEFIGRQRQRPPKYSAKKIGGERAYRLARKGKEVDLEPRDIEVYDFSVTSKNGSELDFNCDVSSGTYVRALARDLGIVLECGAILSSLRRTSVGQFRVEDAQTLPEIEENMAIIGSPADAVGHLPRLSIESEEMRRRIAHGQPLRADESSEPVVAVVAGQELVAIAEKHEDLLKPKVVLES